MNLFDMLANAQNGQGMEMLARQFGLSQQQTQAAVEALLPAFSQGLKRNASDPYGVGAFMTAMASGQHARYFEDAQNAFTPQGMQEGNGILGHLFGSKDLSRAVAAQAAQATGIGTQVLQQMLPVIASMIMGGLFKQSTNQLNPASQAAGFGGSGNPLQEIIEQMMRQGTAMGGGAMGGGGMGMPGGQQRQAPQQQTPAQTVDPFDNPFGKVLKDMFGGAIPGMPGGMPGGQQEAPQRRHADPEPQAPSQNPWGDNPLGKIFEEMLKGAQGGQAGQRDPEPQTQRPRSGQGAGQRSGEEGGRKNPYDDLFGEMFETGRKQRDEYQKGVENIFDQFSKGMDRYR
ncbi:DUF937 domain-containing protein [Mesorhizobium sp. KR9-304]|uniref:DUF937 domain-containing protein n=1 Tax=Mesorhizobium sp. KR9-304 TaxID=3156614 RepID=UPI0032B4877E